MHRKLTCRRGMSSETSRAAEPLSGQTANQERSENGSESSAVRVTSKRARTLSRLIRPRWRRRTLTRHGIGSSASPSMGPAPRRSHLHCPGRADFSLVEACDLVHCRHCEMLLPPADKLLHYHAHSILLATRRRQK